MLLLSYGIAPATTVAMQLLATFNSIRFGLLVGIRLGFPNKDADIRRGGVVVSNQGGSHNEVVQYDIAKALSGGRFEPTGMLNRPPQVLLTALTKLQITAP
ncbi:Pfs domain protein [Penicillium lividum]|nr:Pfs domain protein [Penicillium lividum]